MLALFALLLAGCDAGISAQQVGDVDCNARITAQQTGKASVATASTTFPELTGRVVDGAGLLDDQAAARITRQAETLEAATGNQFVTVTVPSLDGQTIEAFGMALGRHWGIGRAAHDDGILLVVAPAERRVRIEVGCGLEKIMTNPQAQKIVDERILPNFSEGRMQEGIVAGADAIVAILVDQEIAK